MHHRCLECKDLKEHMRNEGVLAKEKGELEMVQWLADKMV